MFYCTLCKTEKPETDFTPSRVKATSIGFRGHCTKCYREKYACYRDPEYHREWYDANRETLNQRQNERRRANPERTRRYRDTERSNGTRRRTTLRRHGLTQEQHETLLESQGGVCAICKSCCPSGRSLAIDHCHDTGKVRGLLCMRCNHGIGSLRDSVELLNAAAMYLQRDAVLTAISTDHLRKRR